MLLDVIGDGAVVAKGTGEHQANISLLHDPGDAVSGSRLETHVGNRGETECSVVMRRLLGVAYEELDVIDTLDRKSILVVVHGHLLVSKHTGYCYRAGL